MIVPEVDDHIFQVTNKYGGGNIIITTFGCLYDFGYLFSLQRFVRDVLRYYNLSLTQIHPNGWIIRSLFEKLLRILNKEPLVRVFRQCYTLISSTEKGPSFLSSIRKMD